MTQLSAMDANFLNVEGRTTLTHIGGLGILDTRQCPGGRLTLGDLAELVSERAHLAPRPLRQRLAEVPLGLDRPYWEDDPDFDPIRHMHEVALPAPGDDRQLATEVARLHATPLDRRRPLWEMCLIHGLAGGRTAVYVKVHHAAIDGVLAAETLAVLLDLSPEPRVIESSEDPAGKEPQRAPDANTRFRNGLLKTLLHPVVTARSVAATLPYLNEVPVIGGYPGVDWTSRMVQALLGHKPATRKQAPRLSAPPTPFNSPVGPHRSFAFGSLPFADVKAIRRIMGVSVNDVMMALCATALRRWLLERDALPDRPLVAAVPVSLRDASSSADAGNLVSLMFAPLPTDVTDPKERFDATWVAMRDAKRRFLASSGKWVDHVSALLPAPVAGTVLRQALRFTPAPLLRAVNLVISNVPGPQFPLYLRGARVLGYYPISVVTDVSGGLNITVFSYDGNVEVGLIACRDMIDDVWGLMDHFHDALAELMEITGADQAR